MPALLALLASGGTGWDPGCGLPAAVQAAWALLTPGSGREDRRGGRAVTLQRSFGDGVIGNTTGSGPVIGGSSPPPRALRRRPPLQRCLRRLRPSQSDLPSEPGQPLDRFSRPSTRDFRARGASGSTGDCRVLLQVHLDVDAEAPGLQANAGPVHVRGLPLIVEGRILVVGRDDGVATLARPPCVVTSMPRSSSGLGRHPLKVVARVQIPYGVPTSACRLASRGHAAVYEALAEVDVQALAARANKAP